MATEVMFLSLGTGVPDPDTRGVHNAIHGCAVKEPDFLNGGVANEYRISQNHVNF